MYTNNCKRCNQETDKSLAHELIKCDKTSVNRDNILFNLYDMLTKHIKSDNKLVSLLHKLVLDSFQLDDGETQELLQFLIAPHLANIQTEYLTALIRSHLVVLAAATLPAFTNYFNCQKFIIVSTKETNNHIKIDLDDYLQYNFFSITNTNHQTTITNCNKFEYWHSDDNPPLLGSSTARKNNPILQSEAVVYASNLLHKHRGNLWVFSDGSVSGKERNIVGGGYVIAQSSQNLNRKENHGNINNKHDEHNILHQQSIRYKKCSITAAELNSLLAALLKIKHDPKINQLHRNITAFCDNKYVVDITNDNKQANPLLSRNLEKLQETIFHISQKVKIQVKWIPSHCGIKLHDLADKLATTAHFNHKATRGLSLGKAGFPQP